MGLIVKEGTYINICTECCKTICNIIEGAGRGDGGAGGGRDGGAGGGEEEVLTEGVEKMELVNESMYIDNCTEYHKTISNKTEGDGRGGKGGAGGGYSPHLCLVGDPYGMAKKLGDNVMCTLGMSCCVYILAGNSREREKEREREWDSLFVLFYTSHIYICIIIII